MRRLLKPLWILLALVFLFEAWLWEHLRPLVALGRRPHRLGQAQGAARRRDRASAALPDAAGLPHPGRAAVSAQAARPVDAGARLMARRDGGAGARQGRQHGRHGLHLRGDAAEAAAASPGSAGSTSTCWSGSPRRTRWSIRSRPRIKRAHAPLCLAAQARPPEPLPPPHRAHPPPHAGAAGGVDAALVSARRRRTAPRTSADVVQQVRHEKARAGEQHPEQPDADRRIGERRSCW